MKKVREKSARKKGQNVAGRERLTHEDLQRVVNSITSALKTITGDGEDSSRGPQQSEPIVSDCELSDDDFVTTEKSSSRLSKRLETDVYMIFE